MFLVLAVWVFTVCSGTFWLLFCVCVTAGVIRKMSSVELWMERQLLTHPTQDLCSLSAAKYSQLQFGLRPDMLPSLLRTKRATWGQSGRWSISWGPFPVQLYGFPTTAEHKLVPKTLRLESNLKRLSELESKHRHPCCTLSSGDGDKSSSNMLRSSVNKRPFIADVYKTRVNSGETCLLAYFESILLFLPC